MCRCREPGQFAQFFAIPPGLMIFRLPAQDWLFGAAAESHLNDRHHIDHPKVLVPEYHRVILNASICIQNMDYGYRIAMAASDYRNRNTGLTSLKSTDTDSDVEEI
jgi:hypothetical protein